MSLRSKPLLLMSPCRLHLHPHSSHNRGASQHCKELPLFFAHCHRPSPRRRPGLIPWLSPFLAGVAGTAPSNCHRHASKADQRLLQGAGGRLDLLALCCHWKDYFLDQASNRLGQSCLAAQLSLLGKGSFCRLESADNARIWSEFLGEIPRSEEGKAAVHLQAFDGEGAGQGDEGGH